MGGMPMPGGWTMSMAWMRMPGQTWPAAAASFVAMWVAMMVPMMLPSLASALRHRWAAGATRRELALVAAGYYLGWAALGIAVYPPGAALAALEMEVPALARAVPIASGVVVLVAGSLQFTAWKARQLACCREQPAVLAGGAFRNGLSLGLHCIRCCAGPTAILLAVGVMDVGAMVAVTAAITLERLTPAGDRAARTVGMVAVAAGLCLIARVAAAG